jgi:hypothetical protein
MRVMRFCNTHRSWVIRQSALLIFRLAHKSFPLGSVIPAQAGICHLYISPQSYPQSGMKLAHRHSTGTGLLFQQETKTLGRIADELA